MIRSKESGGSLTVFLDGEIDHCIVQQLREELESLIKQSKAKRLVLDFADVSFMDSSGVGLLIGRYKTMAARGGQVAAVNLHPPTDRLFRMAGLHRIIAVDQTKEEA